MTSCKAALLSPVDPEENSISPGCVLPLIFLSNEFSGAIPVSAILIASFSSMLMIFSTSAISLNRVFLLSTNFVKGTMMHPNSIRTNNVATDNGEKSASRETTLFRTDSSVSIPNCFL